MRGTFRDAYPQYRNRIIPELYWCMIRHRKKRVQSATWYQKRSAEGDSKGRVNCLLTAAALNVELCRL